MFNLLYNFILLWIITSCLLPILDLAQNKKHSSIGTSKLPIGVVIALLFASVMLFLEIPQRLLPEPMVLGPDTTVPGLDQKLLPLYLYITMLAGMFSKYLWDYTAPNTRKRFNFRLFIRPVIVSPIVFAVLWTVTGNKISVITFCFSFQNGFFWQAILERRM